MSQKYAMSKYHHIHVLTDEQFKIIVYRFSHERVSLKAGSIINALMQSIFNVIEPQGEKVDSDHRKLVSHVLREQVAQVFTESRISRHASTAFLDTFRRAVPWTVALEDGARFRTTINRCIVDFLPSGLVYYMTDWLRQDALITMGHLIRDPKSGALLVRSATLKDLRDI